MHPEVLVSPMADHPLCDERFERLDDAQEEVGATLKAHGATLSEHSLTLADHGRQLAELKTELGQQRELLSQSQVALAGLVATVSAIKDDLARLNGSQMKLIFILVAALAVLAGATKIAELGIF